LTLEEREWITAELGREEQQKVVMHPTGAARGLEDGRVWHLTAIESPAMVSWYGVTLWMPQLVKVFSAQYSNTTVGILLMIPYLVALFVMIFVGHRSDQTLERRYHAGIPLIVSAISLAWLAMGITSSVLISETLWCFVVSFVHSEDLSDRCPNEFLARYSAAAGIALINSIGNLGRWPCRVLRSRYH